MQTWTKEIDIRAPIEQVWDLFDGSLENMQKIMPQVVEHEPVHVTEEIVGSVYRQKYREGKRMMEYDVITHEYENNPTFKKLKVGFNLANMFDITAKYELTKLDESRTKLIYTATNKPLKWFIKLFVMFASDKVVVEFVERVKKVAEEDATVQ
ncbi:SRPBCC family protein [Bacillus sp. FJAT-47783]|uniref:SRPBCC family protein n=1 Tax=Bacillus sp. FJAT-47783 TaxID=2922712 RepID=UPI001FAC7890|nr:SRPBCC family protein [Bacillus sp. FJAT-47783]